MLLLGLYRLYHSVYFLFIFNLNQKLDAMLHGNKSYYFLKRKQTYVVQFPSFTTSNLATNKRMNTKVDTDFIYCSCIYRYAIFFVVIYARMPKSTINQALITFVSNAYLLSQNHFVSWFLIDEISANDIYSNYIYCSRNVYLRVSYITEVIKNGPAA